MQCQHCHARARQACSWGCAVSRVRWMDGAGAARLEVLAAEGCVVADGGDGEDAVGVVRCARDDACHVSSLLVALQLLVAPACSQVTRHSSQAVVCAGYAADARAAYASPRSNQDAALHYEKYHLSLETAPAKASPWSLPSPISKFQSSNRRPPLTHSLADSSERHGLKSSRHISVSPASVLPARATHAPPTRGCTHQQT
jgi:hypothetical protein